MTVDEFLEGSEKHKELDHRNADDDDDYYTISLHRYSNGRHFRYIDSSGMNSDFHGIMHQIDWLENNQLDNWSQA